MPRSFDMSADYDGTVDQVHRTFADEQYWLARLADSGADNATLDSMDLRDDGGIAVATTQVLRRDRLPGIVAQFHQGDLRIGRREIWSPVDGNKATAHVTGDVSGAPVTLDGDATLTPKGAGARARLILHGTVEVRVPLVGGKIETFVSGQLVQLLIAEQRFTTQWLTENP